MKQEKDTNTQSSRYSDIKYNTDNMWRPIEKWGGSDEMTDIFFILEDTNMQTNHDDHQDHHEDSNT